MKFPLFRKGAFSKRGVHGGRWNRRKEGSSLVSVIIGVAFLAAVGLMILTVSTKYIVSVITARNSTDNFYETEGILAEVRTGLIEKASEASEKAYTEVLESYMSNSAKNVNAKMEYSKRYINKLVKVLTTTDTQAGKDIMVEDVKTSGALLADGTTKYKSYQAENGIPVAVVKKLTRVQDAVRTGHSTKMDYYDFDIRYHETKGYSLVLHDLDIDYVNEADYRSEITTDVVFATPDYKFDGDDTFDELKNFLIVTDGILSRSTAASGGSKTSFTGNIYTGGDAGKGSTDKPEAGITVGRDVHGMNVEFNAEKIISRGSMDIYPKSNVTVTGDAGLDPTKAVEGDLWLSGLRVRDEDGTGDSTTLKIYENSYISNDLDIDDDDAEVYLAGTYYGYSYSKGNVSPNDVANDAEYSSAVLINGLNTGLFSKWTDANGNSMDLNRLILAGHTFVERQDKNVGATGSGNKFVKNPQDIVMGESIAVKSDQLAYLVPDEYITGVERNPVLESEYGNKAMFMQNVSAALTDGASPLKAYLNPSEPCVESHASVSGMDVMYLFLNFKDNAAANEYYREYFNGNIPEKSDLGDTTETNSERMRTKADAYLLEPNLNTTFSPSLYLLAGYVAKNYETGALESPDYLEKNGSQKGKPIQSLLDDGRRMANAYYSYCRSLTASYPNPSGSGIADRIEGDTEKLVAEKLLDMSKLDVSKVGLNPDAGSGADPAKPLVYVRDDCTTDSLGEMDFSQKGIKGILVAKGDVTVNKSFRGLIIAGGDVTVEEDFDGLIIAEGKVDVVRDSTLTANIIVVGELLEHVKKDPGLSEIFNSLNGAATDDATKLEQCIGYQNWVKDAPEAAPTATP